jgi:predicted enzyme related to lactoylglutathione lyase
MANAINWFEIPADDFDRAKDFYSKVLDAELAAQEMMGTKMAFLPTEGDGAVGGAICAGEMHKPSADGAVLYLNGGDDLSTPLSRVEDAGGQVLMPKTKITDEIGYMAFFTDTEGNKLAFHSPH